MTRRLTALARPALLCLALLGSLVHAADTRVDPPGRPVQARGALEASELNHIAVFRKVSPSVVNVTTLGMSRDLFSMDVTQVPRGTGTGFIWDEQGHVVTNYHVIQEGTAFRITLSDRSSYSAKVVGAFPDRDLAVLRIVFPKDQADRAARLQPIAIGASADLQVGQNVYAIGNPFGLDQTLTRGIVSALNREIESMHRRTIRGVIQTDAAINPGNSGGPLLDSSGRLIGVNTQIYSPSGASAGIGFAIPVDEVNRVVPRLIRDGRYIRPAIGITAGAPSLREPLQLPKGVIIVGTTANGPAAQAGIKPFEQDRYGRIVAGDVITAVDGEAIADFDDMLTLLEKRRIGERVTLTIWRNGQNRKASVTLTSSD